MSRLLRNVNYPALLGAVVVAFLVNSAGAALDLWSESLFRVIPMAVGAYVAGRVFGKRTGEASNGAA